MRLILLFLLLSSCTNKVENDKPLESKEDKNAAIFELNDTRAKAFMQCYKTSVDLQLFIL